MELLQALGLNIKILLAQLLNFAILIFILWKFAYKPILKFLDDRTAKIAKSVTGADEAIKKLEEIKASEKKILSDAKKEAAKLVENAKVRAEEKQKQVIEKAKEDIGKVINAEKEKMQQEKAQTLKEIKQEIGSLVAQAVEKVLEEKIDSAKDKEIIKKVVKDLK